MTAHIGSTPTSCVVAFVCRLFIEGESEAVLSFVIRTKVKVNYYIYLCDLERKMFSRLWCLFLLGLVLTPTLNLSGTRFVICYVLFEVV